MIKVEMMVVFQLNWQKMVINGNKVKVEIIGLFSFFSELIKFIGNEVKVVLMVGKLVSVKIF